MLNLLDNLAQIYPASNLRPARGKRAQRESNPAQAHESLNAARSVVWRYHWFAAQPRRGQQPGFMQRECGCAPLASLPTRRSALAWPERNPEPHRSQVRADG